MTAVLGNLRNKWSYKAIFASGVHKVWMLCHGHFFLEEEMVKIAQLFCLSSLHSRSDVSRDSLAIERTFYG